jgi:hypothetical protein
MGGTENVRPLPWKISEAFRAVAAQFHQRCSGGGRFSVGAQFAQSSGVREKKTRRPRPAE